MNKTLRISFSLRNTYRVNAILYSLNFSIFHRPIAPAGIKRIRTAAETCCGIRIPAAGVHRQPPV